MGRKIFLYGAGKRCIALCRILQQSEYEIVAVLDSNPLKWGETIEGYRIEAPDQISSFRDFSMCITIADLDARQTVRNMFWQKFQYDLKREISYNELVLEVYKNNTLMRDAIQKHNIYINDKTSILFDCFNGLILGGVEAWTMDVCSELIQSGENSVYIISDQGSYEVPDILKNKVYKAYIDHEYNFSQVSVLSIIEIIIKKLPCRVVTCMTNEVMLAAYLIKRCFPQLIEIISVIHNSYEDVYKNYADFKECSDFYISVSKDIEEEMIRRGIASGNIVNMSCPFFCEKELVRTYAQDNRKPIRLGYAGRMEYAQKRMDILLQCIEALIEKNVYFEFEIAGDGRARCEMESFVKKKYLNEKVKFLGRLKREDIPNFWKQRDICLNFADFEGRSISIIEAMGNGAVPIVTATSGVKEDITNGVSGYIVPIGDYTAIADRIEYLANNREKLPDMGMRAHESVYPKSRMDEHIKFWRQILKL